MNMMTELAGVKLGAPLRAAMRIAGESVGSDRVIEVRNPYTKAIVGTVPKATIADADSEITQVARVAGAERMDLRYLEGCGEFHSGG